MKITDRQGNEFEVVRGEVPTRDFNIGRKEFAEAVSARFATDANECQCQTLEDVLTETGLPNLLVSTSEGTQRVYASMKGAISLALERPNAAFYTAQEASAEAERANLTTLHGEMVTERDTLQAEYDAADTLTKFKDFIGSRKGDRLDTLKEAIPEAQARITQATAARDWNGKAKTVADGEKCVCKVSTEAKALEVSRQAP